MALKDLVKNLVSDMAGETSVTEKADSTPSIIEYAESPWGLGAKLRPAQKFVLKVFYGLPLSTNKDDPSQDDYNNIPVYDMFRENLLHEFSELEYFYFLRDQGRINLKEPPTSPMQELFLSVGRRGGKSALTAFIASYETYRLIRMSDPLKYYQMLETGTITLTTVSINARLASLIVKDVSGHFKACEYFHGHVMADTQQYVKLKTRKDFEYGDDSNKCSVEIHFRGAKASALRGPTNILVIFDEAAFFTQTGGTSFEDCWEAATPSTATFKHPDTEEPEGKIVVLSSPWSKEGMYYRMFEDGFKGGEGVEGRLCIQAPTWEINPTISSRYLKRKYKEKPQTYMQEFGAQFTDRVAGYITRPEDLLQNIVPELQKKPQVYIRRPHFMGLDLGLANDGTAVAISHVEPIQGLNAPVYKFELDFAEVRYPWMEPDYDQADPQPLDFEEVADWIAELCRKFNIQAGLFDQWTGIPLDQALKKRGLKQFQMFKGDKLNSEMYQAFKLLMLDSKLRLYDSKGQGPNDYITEMLALQQTNEGKYKISVEAPKIEGAHDDLSDAIVRSIWLAYSSAQKPEFLTALSHHNAIQNASSMVPYHRNASVYHARKARRNNYFNQRVRPK